MKIVLFDINRLSFEGGAEKYFTEVGEELVKKKNEIIFLGDCRLVLKLYIWLSVIQFLNPIWRLPKLFTQLKKAGPLRNTSNKLITHIPLRLSMLIPFNYQRKKIKKLLEEADLILIKNEIFELIFFWFLKIKNKNKQILVFSTIGYPSPKNVREKFHNLVYLSSLYNYLIKKIGKVIVSNKKDHDFFISSIGLDSKKVSLILYGLDSDYFAKPFEIKTNNDFKILFIGRMEEQKGVYYLKDIIKNISPLKKRISFTLIGSGPRENLAVELAEKYPQVKYLGQLSPEKVRKHYLQSDLVIVPSKWETFSYVCLEAQACGCPVVTFAVPGPADIIAKGTGDLISFGEIKSFCLSIKKYLKLKEKSLEDYKKLKQRISQNTKSFFSLSKTSQALINLIES